MTNTDWEILHYYGSNAKPSDFWTEKDATILIKERTVTINPKKMVLGHPYKFRYCGDELIAIKTKETPIEIYEVLE